MSYLNNTTITLDAVLTKKGRDLLSKGRDEFVITQYSFSDDEIDYTLWDNSHPSGSDYFGNVIQNTPVLEALTDDSQVMKYRLVSIPNVTSTLTKVYLPYIIIDNSSITDGSTATYTTDANQQVKIAIVPKTSIYATGGTSFGVSSLDVDPGYTFLLSKAKDTLLNTNGLFTDLTKQVQGFQWADQSLPASQRSTNTIYTDGDSIVRSGQFLVITLNKTLATFPATTTIPLTITGNESGALFQFTISISRGVVA